VVEPVLADAQCVLRPLRPGAQYQRRALPRADVGNTRALQPFLERLVRRLDRAVDRASHVDGSLDLVAGAAVVAASGDVAELQLVADVLEPSLPGADRAADVGGPRPGADQCA